MAVSCRNYFTHNSTPPDGVDFTNSYTVGLLAQTLQFIYGASELVKCGWDMNAWTADRFRPISQVWGLRQAKLRHRRTQGFAMSLSYNARTHPAPCVHASCA